MYMPGRPAILIYACAKLEHIVCERTTTVADKHKDNHHFHCTIILYLPMWGSLRLALITAWVEGLWLIQYYCA